MACVGVYVDDEELMSVPRIVRVRFDSIAYVISYVSQLRAYVQISCGAGGVRSGGKLCP